MPCRRGCPPPGPPRLVRCRCAPRAAPWGHVDWRCKRDDVFCTTDTCADPDFCITFKPEYCPNVVAVTPQEEDWSGYREDRPPSPPFPEAPPPWLPPAYTQHYSHPPHFSHPAHFSHSPRFLHPLYSPPPPHSSHPPHPTHPPHSPSPRHLPHTPHSPHPPHGEHPHFPNPQYSPTPSQHSAHYTPSCSPSRTSQQPANTTRAASEITHTKNKSTVTRQMGRPSLTFLDDKSHGQPFQMNPAPEHEQAGGRCNLGGTSYPITRVASPGAGQGARCEVPCGQQRAGARAQPISPGLRQDGQQANGNPTFGSNKAEGARCECRMPPAFAHLRCTGNLDGFCNCIDCMENK